MKKSNKKSQEIFHHLLKYDFRVDPMVLKICIALILLSSGLLLVFALHTAHNQNGYFGFPLDDSWIHLQFAKNLNEYGSFSYYKNEMQTSGSTAPFYTALLAIGFFITSNEFILSYSLGIIFFVLSVFVFFHLLMLESNKSVLLAIAGSLLFLFEWRTIWVSLSGMETIAAIFFLLSSVYFYRIQKAVPLAITTGIFLWFRPEAFILIVAFVIDFIYRRYTDRNEVGKNKRGKSSNVNWIYKAGIIFGAIVAFYFLFNYFLSGTFFPNTFAAKVKYYSGGTSNYSEQVIDFLTTKGMFPVIIFSTIGFLYIIKNIFLRRYDSFALYFLWIAGMIIAYGIYLPYLYQNGRYLIPILPFILILGLYGLSICINFLHDSVKIFRKKGYYLSISTVLLLALILYFAKFTKGVIDEYADGCKYINDRQVTTAKWIRNNLQKDAVVATHDVGAVAYYSERRIVDMVGLISPEMIKNIGSFDGLNRFLQSKKVTHLAVLRNWFHLGNQTPLFQTDERFFEIMEVFEYHPASVLFVPQNITQINEQARYLLSVGNSGQAGYILEQSVKMFPKLAWSHFLLGQAYAALGNTIMAEECYRNSLILQPDYKIAKLELERIGMMKNNGLDNEKKN